MTECTTTRDVVRACYVYLLSPVGGRRTLRNVMVALSEASSFSRFPTFLVICINILPLRKTNRFVVPQRHCLGLRFQVIVDAHAQKMHLGSVLSLSFPRFFFASPSRRKSLLCQMYLMIFLYALLVTCRIEKRK